MGYGHPTPRDGQRQAVEKVLAFLISFGVFFPFTEVPNIDW